MEGHPVAYSTSVITELMVLVTPILAERYTVVPMSLMDKLPTCVPVSTRAITASLSR